VRCERPSSAWATRWAAGSAAGAVRLPAADLAVEDWAKRLMADATPLPAVAAERAGADGLAGLAPDSAEDTLLPAAWAELEGVVEPVGEAPRAEERFWLMEMSCSRLLIWTSWLMYSLGSVSAVGS